MAGQSTLCSRLLPCVPLKLTVFATASAGVSGRLATRPIIPPHTSRHTLNVDFETTRQVLGLTLPHPASISNEPQRRSLATAEQMSAIDQSAAVL